jgi:hypothetical protein
MNDHIMISAIVFLFHQCTTLSMLAYTRYARVSRFHSPVRGPFGRLTLEKIRSVISVLLDLSKLLDRGLAFSRGVAIA